MSRRSCSRSATPGPARVVPARDGHRRRRARAAAHAPQRLPGGDPGLGRPADRQRGVAGAEPVPVQRAVEEVRDVLGQRRVVPARAEREQDQQVDVARAEQDGEAGRGQRGAQVAGQPRPRDPVGDARLARVAAAAPARERRRAPRGDDRQQRAAAGRGQPERLGAAARVGLLHAPVGEVGQERAARARAQLLVVLLGRAGRSPPPAPRARPPRGRSRRAGSPATSASSRPHEESSSRTSTANTPSAVSPRSSARCTSVQADSARSSPVRAAERSRRASRPRPRARPGCRPRRAARPGSRARRAPAGSAR